MLNYDNNGQHRFILLPQSLSGEVRKPVFASRCKENIVFEGQTRTILSDEHVGTNCSGLVLKNSVFLAPAIKNMFSNSPRIE